MHLSLPRDLLDFNISTPQSVFHRNLHFLVYTLSTRRIYLYATKQLEYNLNDVYFVHNERNLYWNSAASSNSLLSALIHNCYLWGSFIVIVTSRFAAAASYSLDDDSSHCCKFFGRFEWVPRNFRPPHTHTYTSMMCTKSNSSFGLTQTEKLYT